MLKVRMWQELESGEQKKKSLADARSTLEYLITSYPASNFKANAQTVLSTLPRIE
jgi:outer membrane protein assembly factor BamD (BamD/ComL family)